MVNVFIAKTAGQVQKAAALREVVVKYQQAREDFVKAAKEYEKGNKGSIFTKGGGYWDSEGDSKLREAKKLEEVIAKTFVSTNVATNVDEKEKARKLKPPQRLL